MAIQQMLLGAFTSDPQPFYGNRGVWFGGNCSNGNDTIQYRTINSTSSGTTDFGNLTVGRTFCSSCSNGERGCTGGAENEDTIDYITIATTGNASDFGDLTVARSTFSCMSGDGRGVWFGGYGSNNAGQTIDYITIDTTGNATDFGNATATNREATSGCSNGSRGLSAGGQSP